MKPFYTSLLFILIFCQFVFGQNNAEHWESYIASYENNQPGSTTVRMDIFDQTPMLKYKYVLVTGIKYTSERKDGFPENETFKLLHKVGDELIDLINKNLQQEAFAYDQWIQHSYLIDSMLCFFPAYSLVLWAVLSTCRSQWQSRGRATLFTVAVLVLGSLAWWDAYHVNMAWLPAAAIWAYSVLMLGLLLSAVLLARQWGWRQSWPVVLGLVLAVLADGLIGQFWLSTNTYYPQIRFVNWIVYFSSQVLLQFLPIMLLRRLNADSEPL